MYFQTLVKHKVRRNGSQMEETVMTHCASSSVLLVWIMVACYTIKHSAIHTQLCHAL